ncbi:hypothetical protein [Oceanicaulis sp.]|uniref:hypothetical protein n=1 Tax=Oceanicaulis sp. TaxID=1924941 RepID=UPI003D2BFB09
MTLFFGQNQLPGLQIAQAFLISLGQRSIRCLKCAIDQALDVALDIHQFLLHGLNERHATRCLGIPEVFQHRVQKVEEFLAGPHRRKQLFKVAFHIGFLDRLTV